MMLGADGLTVQVANDFVWPAGKRRFAISEFEVSADQIMVELTPQQRREW
jgi:hypothetical protein